MVIYSTEVLAVQYQINYEILLLAQASSTHMQHIL